MFGCRFISALSGTAARSSVRTLARPPAYRPIGVRMASQRKASGIGILLKTDLLYRFTGTEEQRLAPQWSAVFMEGAEGLLRRALPARRFRAEFRCRRSPGQ